MFKRFVMTDSYIRNITHNTESTAVWNLKPERWGSLLVREKHRKRKICDKNKNNTKIIFIFIIESPVNISEVLLAELAHTLYIYLTMYSICHTLSLLLSNTSLVTNMGIIHCWNIVASQPEDGTDLLKTWAT